MLHEILLSLSGQPSPLLDLELDSNGASSNPFPLLSPPEKALLASLARLSRLHSLLRTHTAHISSSHPSTICRAVSSAISIEGLGKFQKQILDVERAVLGNDSNYVGGYGIVPLSTLVSEFSPWTRRLEWLWGVACFISPESATKETTSSTTSGASLIDYLRSESQTGYLDLQEIALQLIKAAETAWMRQLSMWLLYGELPTFGKEDFFVQTTDIELEDDELSSSGNRNVDYVLHNDLLPNFVSVSTASSILFIGKSLNHIRSQRNRSTADNATGSITGITLETDHLRQLSSLKSPISTSLLANAVTAIRLSVSQTSLSKLLPLPKIIEVLSLIHDFLLLGRGEFVTSLVSNADSRLQARMTRAGGTAAGLGGVIIKEGEVAAALAQTWTELYALQSEEAPVDEELDLARELLSLSIQPTKKGDQTATPSQDHTGANTKKISPVSFADLLFPAETALSLKIQPPIDLFLSNSDMSVYSIMHSYLLGIRRAQLRLGSLWKHTTMRRLHPSPLGPPRSNTRGGQHHLQTQRQRHNERSVQMRQVWATASASLFVLSEIGGYLQGEVIQESWQHFQAWLERGSTNSAVSTSRPGSQHDSLIASKLRGSFAQQKQFRPPTAISATATAPATQQHDPETITVAHRRYLSSLTQSLFLNEVPFTSSLRSFLTSLDHLIALVSRLETVQRNLDLEADEGVVDALADYGKEEGAIKGDLRDAHEAVQTSIKDIIARLRDIDDSRSVDQGHRRMFEATESGGSMEGRNMYIPRKAAGVDQLLMKLDFAGLNDKPEVIDDEDDGDIVHGYD